MQTTPDADRGQSEVLGVALLVGIAVTGAVIVALTGAAALDRDQERVGIEQAETALSQFDAQSSGVALGRSDGARIDFGLPDTEGTASVRPGAGWMRIRYTDLTAFRDPYTANVTNVTLGAVVFQQGERTVGYQGGGLFRSRDNRSVLLSRPEFHYRNGTLTIPVIKTEGRGSVASEVQVTPNGTTRRFPDASRNLTNRVDNTTVVVTVKSRYYEAWADFFRKYTPGIVTVNHTEMTASVQFISLPDDQGVEGGVVATAESGELALLGDGAYVDSYNSSRGPYVDGSSNGTVRAVASVKVNATATIDGTVESGESIFVGNPDGNITGDALYTDRVFEKENGSIEGNKTEIDGVPTVLPIDTLVLERLQEIRATGTVLGGKVEVSQGSSREIDAGRYYMEKLQVEGGDLTLNTTNGNISLAVRDWIEVSKKGGDGGNITVVGDGVVKVYLTSQETKRISFTGAGNAPTRDLNFFVGKNSSVHVPGDVAPRFRVFAPSITHTAIAGGNSNSTRATFDGLIYSPDGLDLSGSAYVKQADVYGGLVAGQIILGQNGRVHYDKNLNDLLLPRASRISRLEFLHVAVHRMNVTDT